VQRGGKVQSDPELQRFVRDLVHKVAGTHVICIGFLRMVLLHGDASLHTVALLVTGGSAWQSWNVLLTCASAARGS